MPNGTTPKDRFTALDTLALVRELRALAGARVDKVFDLPGAGWSIALRVPGESKRELVLVPGRYAALLREGPTHLAELGAFARDLRRLLTGAAIREVADPQGERLLEVGLGRHDERDALLLVVEMFGRGNLIVVGEGKILAVAQPRQWAHRSVRIGAAYVRPPQRVDPWSLGSRELSAELAASRTDLASTLAARLALGGPVAEELIARVGASGADPATSRSEELGGKIHAAMAKLLEEVGGSPTGHLVRREGTIVDATPYLSRRWDGLPDAIRETRPTFSEAANAYFSTLVPPVRPPEVVAAEKAHRDLEHLADRQRVAVEELGRAIADLKAQAETIFAHYPDAEAEVERRRTDAKRGDRSEVPLGPRTVSLYLDRSPRESAQELYAEAKRLEAKLAGARAALAETEGKQLPGPAPPGAPTARPLGAVEPKRATHWFERHRWFVSSEGAIVVGGRDAGSNDLLVRRHLKDGDVYLHADIQGAASVIVKHPDPGAPAVTELTLREAGQWAVAFSKAWRAGLASASAFWVHPDQVSKQGASGEFVARGAWVIHGTKHVMDDLPTEVGIGTIDYRGAALWTVAPPSALRSRGSVRFLLTPGPERERAEREVELARELGISRSLLQALLPAGGLSVRRT